MLSFRWLALAKQKAWGIFEQGPAAGGRMSNRMNHEPLTVLVVEDNEEEVILLQRAFKHNDLDVSVHFVANGEEAIEYLSGGDRFTDRTAFPEPDLVLMDLKMPRKGGFEVLEWFRNLQEGALIPVIVLTSSNRDADIQRAYSLGANTYFIKPHSFDEFRGLVKTLCEYWRLARRPKPLVVRR
jgi:CheY-like chemotaxis protein